MGIITDNTSNNKTLYFTFYKNLFKKFDIEFENIENLYSILQFCKLDSFVCCLVYILYLIIKQFLTVLKTGNIKSAEEVCNQINNRKDIPDFNTLARLRVFVLWLAKLL